MWQPTYQTWQIPMPLFHCNSSFVAPLCVTVVRVFLLSWPLYRAQSHLLKGAASTGAVLPLLALLPRGVGAFSHPRVWECKVRQRSSFSVFHNAQTKKTAKGYLFLLVAFFFSHLIYCVEWFTAALCCLFFSTTLLKWRDTFCLMSLCEVPIVTEIKGCFQARAASVQSSSWSIFVLFF